MTSCARALGHVPKAAGYIAAARAAFTFIDRALYGDLEPSVIHIDIYLYTPLQTSKYLNRTSRNYYDRRAVRSSRTIYTLPLSHPQ